MKISFEINRSFDPNLLDVTLSDEGEFSIEITSVTERLTKDKRLGIRASIMWHNVEKPNKLNFHIDDSCEKYARIVGNIAEALDYLADNQFISREICSIMKLDPNVSDLLSRSKSYVEPSLEEGELVLGNDPSGDEMMQNIGSPTNSDSEDEKPENRKAFFERPNKTPSHQTVEQQTGPDSSLTNSNQKKPTASY